MGNRSMQTPWDIGKKRAAGGIAEVAEEAKGQASGTAELITIYLQFSELSGWSGVKDGSKRERGRGRESAGRRERGRTVAGACVAMSLNG